MPPGGYTRTSAWLQESELNGRTAIMRTDQSINAYIAASASEGAMAPRLAQRLGHLTLIGLLLGVASTVSGQHATYTGLQPDAFMKHWLVLGPVPVSSDSSPDEAQQKKAFADYLLASAGGEAGVNPKAGSKITLANKTYEWHLVQSKNDLIDLKVAKTPEEFSVAYAWAQLDMPHNLEGPAGRGQRRRREGLAQWQADP